MTDGSSRYLLIGHVTADVVPGGRTLGGTVSYAAPIARMFDHTVSIFTSAAACEPLLTELRPHAELSVKVADETTTFENIYTPEGRVQYVHELADPLDYDLIPNGWLSAPLVHLAPLVEEVDPAVVHRFKQATVLLTPQGYLRSWDREGRVSFKRWFDEDVLKSVDIVVFSRPDIAGAPELEAEFAAVVEHLIVTDGTRGGVYYHQGRPFPYTAYPVKEVDPTGAGDVFATSLLASLLRLNGDMHAAVRVASYLAALAVTRAGTDMALTYQEVEKAFAYARESS